MPKPPLPQPAVELLTRPCPATISTLRRDGQPVSVPTWYLYEDGRILVNMDFSRKRLAHLQADPRVSLSIMDPDDWYTHVSLQGHVVKFEDDLDLTVIDRMAQHYTGNEYPNRERKRVNAWVEIDRWHAWGRLAR